MYKEGSCIVEQVEELINDMKILLEDLEGTDSEVIDFEQLRKLSDFSKNYALDIKEFVINRRI